MLTNPGDVPPDQRQRIKRGGFILGVGFVATMVFIFAALPLGVSTTVAVAVSVVMLVITAVAGLATMGLFKYAPDAWREQGRIRVRKRLLRLVVSMAVYAVATVAMSRGDPGLGRALWIAFPILFVLSLFAIWFSTRLAKRS